MSRSEYSENSQTLLSNIIQQLAVLSTEFSSYNDLLNDQLIEQQQFIKRMRIISQRYILIVSTGACCKYPEIYPNPTTAYLLQEMTEKIRCIRISNCILYRSLKKLREPCLNFERLCQQISSHTLIIPQDSLLLLFPNDDDHANDTQLDLTRIQPLSFYIDLIRDLFQYFHAWILKLRHSSHLIEPSNFQYLTVYNDLLKPSEDFKEFFIKSLEFCRRLQKMNAEIQCDKLKINE